MLPRSPFKEEPFVPAAGNESADSLQLSGSSSLVSAAESSPTKSMPLGGPYLVTDNGEVIKVTSAH